MNEPSFLFYDLETSGLDSRQDRIMQFAAIRTDANLNPIGKKYNFLIKLNDDVLPSPQAVFVTKITPQATVNDGYTEAEAVDLLSKEIFTPNTVVVGFNNIRFDDEFIRNLFWRNYQDPYAWAYADGRSRWDVLDLVRLTRAIRPEGIEWPVDVDGKPINKLELLAAANGITHTQAHDALSDVEATIGMAQLIKSKQPKLWQYLFENRHKNNLKKMIDLNNPKPFVYTSGRFDFKHNKTTIAYPVAVTDYGNVLVYNLRHDPNDLIGKTADDIKEFLDNWDDKDKTRPVYFKELKLNRAPAIAPLGVLTKGNYQTLSLDLDKIKQHLAILKQHSEVIKNWLEYLAVRKAAYESDTDFSETKLAECQLYDGFIGDNDRKTMLKINQLTKAEISNYQPHFQDQRLNDLWLGYKARSFFNLLTDDELKKWTDRRTLLLQSQLPQYLAELESLAKEPGSDFYVEELKLWIENLIS